MSTGLDLLSPRLILGKAGNVDLLLTTNGYRFLEALKNGFQPLDSDLTAIAALSPADRNFIVGNGTAWTAKNGQLPFPALQNSSADANTLDDYEEGTWTPTITS